MEATENTLDFGEFPAVAGTALLEEHIPLSFPTWEPHSFLSNSIAKRLGFCGSDQVTVVPYAQGPSPAQMSEVPGLPGHPRLLCFHSRFYQEEYQKAVLFPYPVDSVALDNIKKQFAQAYYLL